MKSIFISGGSRGIGFEIAKRFHAAGWQVGICARGQKGVDEAVNAMPGAKGFVCDLADKAQAKALAAQVLAAMGAPDVLVNNGGVFKPGVMHEEDESVFEELMATNVASAYYLTRGIVPAMKELQRGTIVNLCSIASVRAYSAGGSYAVSKHALLGFSRSLREELKPHNIGVVSVMPGATWTSSWEGAGVPEERMMPAEDIAELVYCSCMLSPRTVVEEILVRPMLGDL
jgi:NAD(P)-dependent dehydrogenase (short-subunit alcohol dehydrogenase family)